MKLKRKRPLNSVVGLTLTHGQLRACHVVRAKGGIEIARSAAAPLTLDLLHPEPALVGQEIRNHLDAAGIRERRCVVAVPASWIMCQQSAVPELAPADLDSLLEIEAEKGFPCDPAQLQLARSTLNCGSSRYVTQLAVRREQVAQLAEALKLAGLKPLSFSPGLPALPAVLPSGTAGRITLRLEPHGATLLIAAGGGIAAFRTTDATIDSEAGENLVNTRSLAREVRITYEQVPADIRRELNTVFLTGDEGMTRQMAEMLGRWAEENRLVLERDTNSGRPVADQIAEHLARRCLEQGLPALEFLPPKPSRWSQWLARYNSRRLASVGLAAGFVALVVGLLFGWQEYERISLRSEWEGMQTQVLALEAVQNRIRDYRSWYDTGYRNLMILKRVTECFPESGVVTAKSFEIHSATANARSTEAPATVVTVSGTARDNAALLRTLDELRKTREVQGLKIEQIRGKVPAQFTFTFRWNTNPGS